MLCLTALLTLALSACALPIPAYDDTPLAGLKRRLPRRKEDDDLLRALPHWAIAAIVVGALAITALSLLLCIPCCRSRREDRNPRQTPTPAWGWARRIARRVTGKKDADEREVNMRGGGKECTEHSQMSESRRSSELSAPPRYEIAADRGVAELEGREMIWVPAIEIPASSPEQHEVQSPGVRQSADISEGPVSPQSSPMSGVPSTPSPVESMMPVRRAESKS